MHWGILNIFCAICGKVMRYDPNKPGEVCHHHEFGLLCSKSCFAEAEMKYARMITGNDEPLT